MVIDLNEKEIKLIEMWYACAAGESYTEESDANFGLLEKLGIPVNSMNLITNDLDKVGDYWKAEYASRNAAISRYLARHPEHPNAANQAEPAALRA